MTDLTRRTTLGLLAVGTASACSPAADTAAPAAPAAASELFRHGVASGDPRTDSVVLWTRVSGLTEAETVRWEVAGDDSFAALVASGEATAGPDRDFTVKVVATGLQPGASYAFRFTARGAVSMTGHTRTLPTGQVDRLGVALVTCSNYAFGFFHAYLEIARDPAIQFVLHTGDYIYEYGGEGSWGQAAGKTIGREHEPAHEIVTLADYRIRHAQYKSDAGSIAMHAAHPLLCCWDDHESANNPWTGGADNHQPETEGDWIARRTAAIQAYYEWMPIREPEAGRTREEFWRTYVFGDLATLVTLESRHTGRDQQVDYKAWQPKLKTDADFEAFRRDVINDPSRRMLSPAMEAELSASLAQSVTAGQPWRLIGNASPIARMLVPDLVKAGDLPPPAQALPAAMESHLRLALLGRYNLPFYTDTWDGYPAAREALYAQAAKAGARDLVFLTGDSHSFWANRLFDAAGQPMGLEIGSAGVTSPGDFVESGFGDELSRRLDAAFARELAEVDWTDNMHQGYVRAVFGRETATVDFVAIDSLLTPDYRASVLRSETVVRTAGGVDYQRS